MWSAPSSVTSSVAFTEGTECASRLEVQSVARARRDEGAVLQHAFAVTGFALAKQQTVEHLQSLHMSTNAFAGSAGLNSTCRRDAASQRPVHHRCNRLHRSRSTPFCTYVPTDTNAARSAQPSSGSYKCDDTASARRRGGQSSSSDSRGTFCNVLGCAASTLRRSSALRASMDLFKLAATSRSGSCACACQRHGNASLAQHHHLVCTEARQGEW